MEIPCIISDKLFHTGHTNQIIKDMIAVSKICKCLRRAACNLYINDKPTGAIVGLQAFGGSHVSDTSDEASGEFKRARWISPRTI